MPETPTHDEAAENGAWLGCLTIWIAFSVGICLGIVLMLMFT